MVSKIEARPFRPFPWRNKILRILRFRMIDDLVHARRLLGLGATLTLDRQRTEALCRLERAMAMLKTAAMESVRDLAAACQIISRRIGIRRFWTL